MADNLKPYDPNKGFISFRLNPDAIKEALIEQVPYNRTLRYIYNNPEGDIRETAKFAASETPILGSLLAGEPVDAAKEAFLLGMPVKSTKALNKINPNSEIGLATGYGNDMFLVKSPRSRKTKAYNIDDETGNIVRNKSYDGELIDVSRGTTDLAGFNQMINNSNKLHELRNKLSFGPYKTPVGEVNADVGVPRYTDLIDGKPRLIFESEGPIGKKYTAYNEIQDRIDEASKAKLRKNEEIKWILSRNKDTDRLSSGRVHDVVIYNNNTGKFRDIGSNTSLNPGGFSTWDSDVIFKDIPDKNIHARDMKYLQSDINVRNAGVDFTRYPDDFIEFNTRDPEKYQIDYDNLYNQYYNALYGPYYQDIIKPSVGYNGYKRDNDW